MDPQLDVGNYISLVVAALAVMGSPGPATVGAAATALAFGMRRSLRYLLGSSTGTIGVLIAVSAGLGPLVAGDAALGPVPANRVLLVVSVVYLLWLSWRIASAPPPTVHSKGTRAPSFFNGFVLGIANPKAYAALAAIVTSHWPTGTASVRGAALVIAPLLAILIVGVHFAWAAAGVAASRTLSRPRISRVAHVLLAIILAASTIPLVVDAFA